MKELIGQGRTADVFKYSEDKVIKIFHKDFSQLAFEEYATAKNIQSVGISAPFAYELIDVDDKKGIIYEYVQGICMLQLIQKAPLKVKQYAKQLADLQVEMHSKTVNSLPNIKESLSATIRGIQSIKQEDKEPILNYLNGLPNGDRLCHYDFHPGNILIFEGSAKVIDWMTAHVGDPHADVCRTSLILRSNVLPPNTSAVERTMISIFRKVLYGNYINQYLRVTGGTLQKVEQWLLPVAAARLAEGIESEIPYLNNIISRIVKEIR